MTGPRRRLLAWFVAATAVVVAGAGCASRYRNQVAPTCRTTATLVLMAQSVPTAERVPCIAALPAGWSLKTMEIRNGRSSFTLDSDRAGDAAVKVSLDPRCQTAGASEVNSDEPGTRRYEKVDLIIDGYRGVRLYVFRGGCVTYRFNFARRGMALVNQVSLMVDFATRAELAPHVPGGRI